MTIHNEKHIVDRIKELSIDCDVMIVIGSFTSANSKRLTELAVQRNKNSYQVVNAIDIKESWFKNIESVGISAGASTPDNIIDQVIAKIKIISKIDNKEEIYEQQSV